MRKKVLTVTAIVSGIYVAALWVITSHAAGTEVVTQPLDNLKTLVIAVIGAVGLIILGWGVVQVGMSFQSHDPSQRSNGFLTLAGGIVITFTKEILDLIVG